MKNLYKSFFVLVLGIAAFSSVMGQKSSSEYDDVYYIPSDKKSVQSTDKTEVVPSSTVTPQKKEVSDYEKYINSLNNQNAIQTNPAPGMMKIHWNMPRIRIMPAASILKKTAVRM